MIDKILRLIVLGTIRGGIYSLLALGFTLIYGISGVINLSYGSFFMIGTYMFIVFGFFLGFTSPLSLLLAIVFSLITAAILGALSHRIVVNPILGDEVAVMVATVTLALIIQEIFKIEFSWMPRTVTWPPGSFLTRQTNILGVYVLYSELFSTGISLIMFVILWLLIEKTKIGKAMQAVSQDREAAMLMGVNVDKLYMLTMAISASLSGLSGILITTLPGRVASPFMWLEPLALAFSIVILGGLGSIKGSLIGAFIVGFADIAMSIFVAPELSSIAPLAVMVAVLLVRPKGLFGKRVEME